MIRLLNAPYPFYENTRQGIKICLSIGIFIMLFCVLIRPFGLDQISTPRQIGYGLVSFFVCAFYIILLPLIFNSTLKNEGWKIYKEILWVSLITFSLALANYFYSGYAFEAGYGFDLNSFFLVLFYTALVAIIPAITIILYKQLFVYKKVIKEVEKIDAALFSKKNLDDKLVSDRKIEIHSDAKNESLELTSSEFLFLMSSGNYVEIYYNNGDGLQKKLIRNNISKVESQLKNFPRLLRCHRSFLINLDQVNSISGNLQGYQLEFNNLEWQVPVSRSYTKSIKTKLLS